MDNVLVLLFNKILLTYTWRYTNNWGFPGGSVVKISTAMQESQEM